MTDPAPTFDCYSLDGDSYTEGTEAQAIAEALGENGPGSVYWLGVKRFDQAGDFVDGDDIVDLIRERAAIDAGEHADNWLLNLPREAVEQLEAMVTAWAEKHATIDFWTATHIEKRTAPGGPNA